MELKELTEFLVKSVVSDPDTVSVKQLEDEDIITIEVLVTDKEMGNVIGRKGIVANAIRTVISAASKANNLKSVKINISSY